MDMDMGFLGLSTMTYNFFLRAGAKTVRDIVDILEGNKKSNVPEQCMMEAEKAIKMQEKLLKVKILKKED